MFDVNYCGSDDGFWGRDAGSRDIGVCGGADDERAGDYGRRTEGVSFADWGQRLRTVRFVMGGKEYQAIEQNPEKPSRWGKLARDGRRVVQVRDLGTQKYVAAVVDGKVTE